MKIVAKNKAEGAPPAINPAEVDAHAQGFAGILRQVGTRHGDIWALVEASGCILAGLILLTDFCGPAEARDTMAWFAERAAVPLGPEAHAPTVLTDDGIQLPEPRTISASSHHIVRNVRRLARVQGISVALEVACGALRGGIAVAREEIGAEKLASMLDRYAGVAGSIAALDDAQLAAMLPETLQ